MTWTYGGPNVPDRELQPDDGWEQMLSNDQERFEYEQWLDSVENDNARDDTESPTK